MDAMEFLRRRQKVVAAAAPWERAQTIDAIGYFRKMGFFPRYVGLSDAEVAEALDALWREQGWDAFVPTWDIELLGCDTDRVWWDDTEDKVQNGEQVWTETICDWARISRGSFAPQDVVETWDGEDGPIWVSFRHGGKQHRILVAEDEMYGFMAMAILEDLNALIASTGYRFRDFQTWDQTSLVLVLTDDEARRLVADRGWEFRDE